MSCAYRLPVYVQKLKLFNKVTCSFVAYWYVDSAECDNVAS